MALLIEVEDTGIGIPEDRIETVFGAFDQAKSSSGREYGGTGLGLAITKRLVELMGGRISVRSEEGKGSTFRVRIPDIPVPSVDPSAATRVTDPGSGRVNFLPATVLVADDISRNRELISGMLDETGLSLVEASDGDEALRRVRQLRPDLVLLDIKMPGLSGLAVMEAMRDDPRLSDIPVIVVSAAVLDDEVGAVRAAADAFLPKPITRDKLVLELMRFLPRQVALGDLSESGPAAREDDREAVAGDLKLTAPVTLEPELAESLAGLSEEWRELMQRQTVNDIEAFGRRVEEIGRTFRQETVRAWGARLAARAEQFEIDRMLQTLDEFRHFIPDADE